MNCVARTFWTALSLSVLSLTSSASGARAADAPSGSDDSLQSYLGFNQSNLRRLQTKAEETVQKCMKAEGFDYFPAAFQAPKELFNASGELDQEGFARKYGYGVSTLIDPTATSRAGGAQADKNAAYVAKLAPADKKAYYRTLLGAEDPKAANRAALLSGSSCQSKAVREIFGSLQSIIALGPKIDALQKRIDSRPEVVAADKKWAGCMKEAGFTFAKQSQIQNELQKRLRTLLGPSATAGPGGGGGGFFGGAGVDTSKVDEKALGTLQKDELAIAKADQRCTKKHLDVREKLQKEAENQFIRDNRAVLDDFRTKVGRT